METPLLLLLRLSGGHCSGQYAPYWNAFLSFGYVIFTGKVIISQACVKNSVQEGAGGVCLSACWDTPPWANTPWQTPPGQTPPLANSPWQTPPAHPTGMHVIFECRSGSSTLLDRFVVQVESPFSTKKKTSEEFLNFIFHLNDLFCVNSSR